MPNQVPVSPGIFSWPADPPRLLGSRCTQCGNHMFPVQSGCSRCTADSTEPVELGRHGTLWAWTVQGFAPKAPPYVGPVDETFEPYGVGYVELPGQVTVEARLTESDPGRLSIGMEMELVLTPLAIDADGNEIITFAFQPVLS